MCGINGLIDFGSPLKDGERIVGAMNQALAHRGPDGEGVFVSKDEHAILGSRRLSIVDVAGGAMPITLTHGGSEYAIVSNSEFFNHKELRTELEAKYEFKTLSDTEAALFAYLEWGEKCVERLHGQFAFIIYDGKHKRVFFARDRVGIKPLYYTDIHGALAISSEPKGILTHPDFVRKPDAVAIADYFLGILALGKSEPLGRSFFEGLYSLPPATYAIYDAKGLRTQQYDDVSVVRSDSAEADLARDLRREVERAVREQIPEEVSYGLLLSGGLDSSVIAALTAREEKRPEAATVLRYEGAQNPDYEPAKLMAEREHIELIAPVVSEEELMCDVDAVVRALDRPCDSVRELGLYEMYGNLKRKGITVVLVGEGADEFNLGYYYVLPGFAVGGELCASADSFRSTLRNRTPDILRYFSPEFVDENTMTSVIEHNVYEYYERPDASDSLDRMEYYYIRKFLKGRLDMHDRLGMAHSLEARVPYCDDGVIAASLAVPPEMNLAKGTEKSVLREAFADVLPEEIAHRRKYALSESKNTSLYRAILESFDTECAKADDSVWRYVSKEYAAELRDVAEEKIIAAEKGELYAHDLTGGTPLGRPLEFRIRHLFVLLTFLRWYSLYFTR